MAFLSDDQYEREMFTDLVEKVGLLMKARKAAKKVFISYAWEADSQENAQLQTWLKQLQSDLQATGAEVFLDVADMSGNMSETMQTNIERSDVALVIGTPRLGERASQQTNVAFEIKHIISRAETAGLVVMPLLRAGQLQASFPASLYEKFSVRDAREGCSYSALLAAIEMDPPGLIPAIWDLSSDAEYEAILDKYNGGMNSGNNNLSLAAGTMDRVQHKIDVLRANRVVLNDEKSRETALSMEQSANEQLARGGAMGRLGQKMVLETALPYFVDGFGEDHEKTIAIKQTIASLSDVSPTMAFSMEDAFAAAASALQPTSTVPSDSNYLYTQPLDLLRDVLESVGGLGGDRSGKAKSHTVCVVYTTEDMAKPAFADWVNGLRCDLAIASLEVISEQTVLTDDVLASCDHAIIVGTPLLAQQAENGTGVGPTMNALISKASESKIVLLPLLREGDFGTSFPKPLLGYLIRDMRDNSNYDLMLIQLKDPLGIIPAIWGIRIGDQTYHTLETDYLRLRDVPGNDSCRNPRPTTIFPRDPNELIGLLSGSVNPRQSARVTGLRMEAEAYSRKSKGAVSDLAAFPMILQQALPKFIEGFGAKHAKTVAIQELTGGAGAPGGMAMGSPMAFPMGPPSGSVMGHPALAAMAAMAAMGHPGMAGMGHPGMAAMGHPGMAGMGHPAIAAFGQPGGAMAHPGVAAMGGVPDVAAMLQQMGVSSSQTAALNLAAARPAPSILRDIHVYLLEKIRSDKGRIEDFRSLLVSLKSNCDPSSVVQHLQTHSDFHHRNIFKGNRYHDLRLQLATLPAAVLEPMLASYLSFLEGSPSSPADQELRSRLLPL